MQNVSEIAGEEALSAAWRAAFDLRRPIVTQIYLFLRGQILTLALPPKHKLSEKDLSERLGVSRTPVREALIRLAEEGLTDILPQRGTFVAPIRVPEVREAQFVREALETAIAGRAAETVSPQLEARLSDLLTRQSRAIAAGDRAMFYDSDEAFHQALCEHCGLGRTWKTLQNVKGQLDRVRYLSLPDHPHLETLLGQHQDVCAAITRGDSESAIAAMRLHLQEVFRTVETLMRERPEIFDREGV